MSYRFNTKEKPEAALRRAAQEQLRQAVAMMESKASMETALHDVRKCLKKTRAILRMSGKQEGNAGSGELKAMLREIAGKSAGVRDAQVQMRALQKISAILTGKPELELCRSLQTESARKALSPENRALRREIAADLKQAMLLLKHWPSCEQDWGRLKSSWKKARKRNIEAMRKAFASPGAQSFHEWRKCAKTWWYQSRLLGGTDPEEMGKLARRLRALTELLGDDHDLSLIQHRIVRTRSEAATRLRAALKSEREKLQKRAVTFGEKLAARF